MTPESKGTEYIFVLPTSLQTLPDCCSGSPLSLSARCMAVGAAQPLACTWQDPDPGFMPAAAMCPHLGWLSELPCCDMVGKCSWQHSGPATSPMPPQTQPSKPRLLELPQQAGDVGVVAPDASQQLPLETPALKINTGNMG